MAHEVLVEKADDGEWYRLSVNGVEIWANHSIPAFVWIEQVLPLFGVNVTEEEHDQKWWDNNG